MLKTEYSQLFRPWLLGFTVFSEPFKLDSTKWSNTPKQFMGNMLMNAQGSMYAQDKCSWLTVSEKN